MAKQNRTKPTDKTEYRVYMEHCQEDELVDKLLGLFVHAFMYNELDTLINQRSNNSQLESNEEDKNND